MVGKFQAIHRKKTSLWGMQYTCGCIIIIIYGKERGKTESDYTCEGAMYLLALTAVYPLTYLLCHHRRRHARPGYWLKHNVLIELGHNVGQIMTVYLAINIR